MEILSHVLKILSEIDNDVVKVVNGESKFSKNLIFSVGKGSVDRIGIWVEGMWEWNRVRHAM